MKEKILWWSVFLSLACLVAFTVLGVVSLAENVFWSPETFAFVVGLFGFWLFANRLIFGYSGIIEVAKAIIDKREEEVEKEKIGQKAGVSSENVNEYSLQALLFMWKSYLEPFKFSFFLAFFLILALNLLFELNIITFVSVAPVVKAFFLGSAIPALFVWSLELMATYYVFEVMKGKGSK